MTGRNQHYPRELRERAVRMVAEVTPNYDSQWAAINAVAQKLGVGTAETVRKWVRQAEVDGGQRPGTATDESAELKRLHRENAELRRANEILKAASVLLRQCHDDHCPAEFAQLLVPVAVADRDGGFSAMCGPAGVWVVMMAAMMFHSKQDVESWERLKGGVPLTSLMFRITTADWRRRTGRR